MGFCCRQIALFFVLLIESKNILLAASESGKLFFLDAVTGSNLFVVQNSLFPITAICYWLTRRKNPHILIGSAETTLREYDCDSKNLVRYTNVSENVQCLEHAWDFAFIGTTNGSLIRYSVKLSQVKFEEKISKDSILVLKATQEGARHVLLVGTRNAPVCVRDALSGLHLRTMNDLVTPTVYSLVLEKSMVYCGTTFHDILVFSFHDGSLVHKHQAANSKGISCMKVVNDLLFASCYNGNIYVYDAKRHKKVGVIEGPGGVILSMEVVNNLVIVGTMSLKFVSILIPNNILQHNE